MVSAAVCFDTAVARIVLAAGLPVVLCGPDGEALSRAQSSLRSVGGRMALFIGDPGVKGVTTEAVAMAGELFGHYAVVAGSPAEAGAVASGGAGTALAHPGGADGTGT